MPGAFFDSGTAAWTVVPNLACINDLFFSRHDPKTVICAGPGIEATVCGFEHLIGFFQTSVQQVVIRSQDGRFHAQLTAGIIVGQLPSDGGAQEQFGFVLEKGSALTACVSAAVDALKADGTFAALLTEWIADKASAPVLK